MKTNQVSSKKLNNLNHHKQGKTVEKRPDEKVVIVAQTHQERHER
jgi:hypothetical protein